MKGEWGAMGETQLENARDNFSRNKASEIKKMLGTC
jgi:hypothetical protein